MFYTVRKNVENVILMQTVRYIAEFFVKVACLALLQAFGDKVTVKTVVTNFGDLIVMGVDSNQRTIFEFTVPKPLMSTSESQRLTVSSLSEFVVPKTDEERTLRSESWQVLDNYSSQQMAIVARLVNFNQQRQSGTSMGELQSPRSPASKQTKKLSNSVQFEEMLDDETDSHQEIFIMNAANSRGSKDKLFNSQQFSLKKIDNSFPPTKANLS